MKEYVVGFLYSQDLKRIALIHKLKPEWQKDKLNGVGGKVEEGEPVYEAMVREFKEEAGLEIRTWRLFATIHYNDCNLYCYSAVGDLNQVKSLEEEQIRICIINNLCYYNTIPNLKWIVPMGCDTDNLEAVIKSNYSEIK